MGDFHDYLMRTYPKLFPLGPARMGIEDIIGWRNLIEELCSSISEILEEDQKEVQIEQVKEKFGTLRFYISRGSEKVYDLIDEAEERSSKICSVCGNLGSVENSKGSWIRVLCDMHQE